MPFTTHKDRAEHFQQRTSYPKREVVPKDLSRARTTTGPNWKELGPPDVGGRLTSLAVDPANPDRVFAGSAGGGVWFTENAGGHWKQVWSDHSPILAIGSLAFDPRDASILYAGTGEANLSGETYPGAGIFKTCDGGATWLEVGSCANVVLQQASGAGATRSFSIGVPRRIGTIAVDPFDSNHIFLGGVTHSEEEGAALYETHDGGGNWDQAVNANGVFEGSATKGLLIGPFDYYCHSVVFHPTERGWVLAALEARGTMSGIWLSKDNGKSWTQATQGLPGGDQFGRFSFAVSAGSKTVYALAGQQGTQAPLGVFRSDDLGDTWKACTLPGFGTRGGDNDRQLSYTNCIAVDPANPMTVIVGSLELHRSTDGGQTWRQISDGRNPFGRRYVHRDHHALWIGQGRVYSANDGGFAVSEDGGDTWKMRNTGLAIALLYDVAVAPSNSGCLGCGMQDNGTWFMGAIDKPRNGFTPPTVFRQELQADGGWCCYDRDDETHIYASQQHMDLWRHRSRDGWTNLDLRMIPDEERRSVWMAVLAMDRSVSAEPRTAPRAVYIGSNRLWRSLDDGDTWQAISDPFDGSVISAIEVTAVDPNFIYVGTTNGGVFRTSDGGATWSRNLAGPFSPGRVVTRIASSDTTFVPGGVGTLVYYTIGVVANEWSPQDTAQASARILRQLMELHRPDGSTHYVEFHHVLESWDGGANWADSDGGFLPNLPHNAVAPAHTGEVFVAHDGGVAVQRGSRFNFNVPGDWLDITGNLPNIRVTDLVWHEKDLVLIASTYGRGVWMLRGDELTAWLSTRAE